jgi:hypothetical protein
LGAPPASPRVDDHNQEAAQWNVDGDHRGRFGALTGDYNGIHQWDGYARRLGFRKAFAHPQRLAAQCLARLPAPDGLPMQLDLWIKGTVFYGSGVVLSHAPRAAADGQDFALTLAGDERPALAGSLCKPLPVCTL